MQIKLTMLKPDKNRAIVRYSRMDYEDFISLSITTYTPDNKIIEGTGKTFWLTDLPAWTDFEEKVKEWLTKENVSDADIDSILMWLEKQKRELGYKE